MQAPTSFDGEIRPWGSFEILLEEENYKVKRITVQPKKRLSYQKHQRRQEVWTIVQGQATVVVDGEELTKEVGEVAFIPLGAAHRMINQTDQPLVFIEVQTGTYFGEDDIIRLQDDFGRS